MPARYLCILAAGDPRFQLSEAALQGLAPAKFAATGANGGKQAEPSYPPFEEVLAYLQAQLPSLGRRPAEGAGLALPPKVR